MFRLYISILLLIKGSLLLGQEVIVFSDHIGASEGLSSQICKAVVEDEFGSIWIGLFSSVCKYDGFNTKEFNTLNTFNDEKFFHQIAIDLQGRIWMIRAIPEAFFTDSDYFFQADMDISIHIADPLTNEVTTFQQAFPNSPFDLNEVIEVYVRDNQLFFYTINQELYGYNMSIELLLKNIDKSTFIGVENPENYFKLTQDKQVHKVSFDGDVLDSLNIFNLESHPFLYQEKNGGLVVGSFFPKQENLIIWKDGVLQTSKRKVEALGKKIDENIVVDNENGLLLENGHLNIEDWGITKEQANIVNSRICSDFIVGKSGLVYMATGLGVYVFDKQKQLVSSIKNVTSKVYSMRKMIIEDDLVISIKQDKEYIVSPSSKYNTDFINDEFKTVALIDHLRDPKDMDVVFSCGWAFSHHVRKINFKNETVELIKTNELLTPILGLFRSNLTRNLYAFGGGGIAVYSEKDNSFAKTEIYEGNLLYADKNTNLNNQVNCIIEHEAKLWIGKSNGLLVFDELKNEIVDFKYNDLFSNIRIQYLHFDRFDEDVLWIGTSKRGLKKLNIVTGQLDSWDETNGLSNNAVHYIYQDIQNRLWMSTNNLLNCLDVESNNIYVFDETNGIAHTEFNSSSFHKNNKTGVLYLGGLDGISHFKPDSINFENKNPIEIRLLSAQTIDSKGKIKDCDSKITHLGELEMNEDHSSLNLELGTSNIFRVDEKVFAYRIPPIINEWQSIIGNKLNLARLPYGNHKLHFVANHLNPMTKSNELIVNLSVNRPFRKTWTFWIGSLLIFLALVWLFFKQRTKNMMNRNIQLEKIVNERTEQLEQANKSKTRIFQILAHDLRSPIASLSNLTKMVAFLSSKDRLGDLEVVAQETERKVNALNVNLDNLLQWAIIEKGNITNKPVEVKIRQEFKILSELYKSQIEIANIEFEHNLEPEDTVMVDITIFQTICRNALHNAVKFSKRDGVIGVSFQELNDYFEIKITNTFDPALTDAQDVKGNGLGMQISEELASLANGYVDLKIDNLGITEFRFCFKRVFT